MDRFFHAIMTLGLVVSPLAIAPKTLAGEDPPSPESVERVNRILAEWHAKASKNRTIEVRFRQKTRSKIGIEQTRAGRAILATPKLGFLETSAVDAQGQPVEIVSRIIWQDRSVLDFEMIERNAIRYVNLRNPSRLPAELRLPFLFDMTLDAAKRDYEWAVLRDEGEQIILAATACQETRPDQVKRKTFISLSRRDFLPEWIDYREPNGDSSRFEAVEIRLNSFTDREGLESPCLDAWTVTERDGRFFRPFLQ